MGEIAAKTTSRRVAQPGLRSASARRLRMAALAASAATTEILRQAQDDGLRRRVRESTPAPPRRREPSPYIGSRYILLDRVLGDGYSWRREGILDWGLRMRSGRGLLRKDANTTARGPRALQFGGRTARYLHDRSEKDSRLLSEHRALQSGGEVAKAGLGRIKHAILPNEPTVFLRIVLWKWL